MLFSICMMVDFMVNSDPLFLSASLFLENRHKLRNPRYPEYLLLAPNNGRIFERVGGVERFLHRHRLASMATGVYLHVPKPGLVNLCAAPDKETHCYSHNMMSTLMLYSQCEIIALWKTLYYFFFFWGPNSTNLLIKLNWNFNSPHFLWEQIKAIAAVIVYIFKFLKRGQFFK